MRKNYFFATALMAIALTGCSQDEQLNFANENKSTFIGVMEMLESRTSLNGENKVEWSADDQISIFEGDNANSLYRVNSLTDGKASFEFVSYSEPEEWEDLDANYAVYPYNVNNSIENGAIYAPVASEYTFINKESSIATALMVAKSEGYNLNFTNAQSIVCLRLNAQKASKYGAIKSIKLTSLKGKNLSGKAKMTWDGTNAPVAVINDDKAGQELTIKLDANLQVNLPESTTGEFVEYYVPIVPTKFDEEDLKLTIIWANDETYSKVIPASFEMKRAKIKNLKHTVGKSSFDGVIDDEIVPEEISNGTQLIKALSVGGEFTLQKDITLDEAAVIPEGKTVTLKLNGKTLTGTGVRDANGDKIHTLVNNGTLTISGGNIESTGTNGGSAVYNNEGATMTLNNVIINGAPQEGSGWPSYAINSMGTLTINGAEVTSNHGAIALYGNTIINDANVVMNGFGGSSHVFYIGGDGTEVIVNGGTYTHNGNVDGSLAYIMTGTTMTINGGTFSASNGGYGLATYTGSLIVKGGTFANAFQDWGGPISISGGTFKTKPAEKYIVEGYSVVTNSDNTHTVLKGDAVANDNKTLTEALSDGKSNIALGEGSFTMPATNGDITISGTTNTVITIDKPTAKNVTLSGVTIQGLGDYTGIQHSQKVVYENCVVKGTQFLYANEVEFNNCTIDLTEVVNYIWTYGAKNVTFDNCIFNTNGKAILIYAEDVNLVTNVIVKNCTFNATASESKAAIEIDSSLATNGHYTLTTENNIFDSNFSGEWRIKKSGTNNTTVNGVVYNAVTIDGKTIDAE